MTSRFTQSRIRILLLAPLLCLVVSGCGYLPQTTTSPATLTDRFQDTLNRLQREHKFPGATAAVMLPDDTIISVASGKADLDRNLPMHPTTQQYIGDVGMSFISALALIQANEGTLNLDRPIHEYLDTRGADAWFMKTPFAERVTMRHLLTHTSGIRDSLDDVQEVQPAALTEPLTMPETWIDDTSMMKSDFRPGTGFAQSQMGILLAGVVLETVSDTSIEELLHARLFGPHDLTRTTFATDRYPDAIATGYGGGVPSDFEPRWSGTSLISNPQDLVKWAKALYKENIMDAPYLEDLLASGYRGSNRESEYGLGVYIYDTTAGEAYGHTGSFPGYETNLIYFPRDDIAVCIQVNSSSDANTRTYVQELAQVILNSLPR